MGGEWELVEVMKLDVKLGYVVLRRTLLIMSS